jgi:hypothetical protein
MVSPAKIGIVKCGKNLGDPQPQSLFRTKGQLLIEVAAKVLPKVVRKSTVKKAISVRTRAACPNN